MLKREPTEMEAKLRKLCEEAAAREGLVLYDMDFTPSKGLLQVFIMREDTQTATIEDCVQMDKALTPAFDASDWIPDGMTLEVSSPGVYRKLSCKWHFELAMGKTVSVFLEKRPAPERTVALPSQFVASSKFTGRVAAVGDEGIALELGGIEFKIAFSEMRKANKEDDYVFGKL
jgi:ribosome maturation factor RimP